MTSNIDGAPSPARSLESSSPVSPLRRRICVATILACLPYLFLKTMWVLGWSVGSDDPEFADTTRVANLLTGGLELCAIGVALLLVHPRGRRSPAFVIAGPAWVATGLLAPLAVGVTLGAPLQLITGGGNAFRGDGGLDGWVFGVVYGGFITQAVLLLTGFALYVRQRWQVVSTGGRSHHGAGTTKPLQDLLGIFFVLGAVGYVGQQFTWVAAGAGPFDDPSTSQRAFLVVGALFAAGGTAAYIALIRGARLGLPWLVLAWVGSAVIFTRTLTETLTTLATKAGEWGATGTGPGEAVAALFVLLCALGGAIGGALRLVEEERPAQVGSAGPGEAEVRLRRSRVWPA